jgi:hypothetical protein
MKKIPLFRTSEKIRYFSALMMKNKENKTEMIFFIMILLLHLFPIVVLSPFVTLDGPTHLYNANLMKSLLTENNVAVNHFFEFNGFPHPNWTGHFLLTSLLFVFPPLFTEKIFLMLIIVLSAVGYRKLVKTIEPSSVWLSWLYFPFLLSFPFLLGFYNFSFALAILPWWLSFWIRNHRNKFTSKLILQVALFFLVLYFSHLVVFLLSGLFAGLISIFSQGNNNRKAVLKDLKILLVCSTPGLLFTIIFLASAGTGGFRGEVSRLPGMQLLSDILYSRMFIVYDYPTERSITLGYSVLMVLLIFTGVFHRTVQRFQKTFFTILIISLALIFIMPDSMASGGILSVRLVQWFFMALILWLVTLRIPKKFQVAGAVLSALFSVGMMRVHWRVQLELNGDAKEYISMAEKIEGSRVLLPLNYSGNWMHSNLSCYLGATKKIVVLDNYEATHDLFPLLWKKGMDPEIHMGNHVSSNHPCVRILSSEKQTGMKVNYITMWHSPVDNNDSCDADVKKQIDANYQLEMKGSNSSLYVRKQE